jgi:flagellin
MISQSKLRLHNRAFTNATERLATGSQINSSKDNPVKNYEAGNANSEIRNTDRAKQNSYEGAALLQIAEGTCNEIQAILQRMKELSIQAANDTVSSTERLYLNNEASELLSEIDRIAAGTTYNAKQIFGNGKDSFSGETRSLKEWNPFIRKDSDGNDIRAGILHIGPSVNPNANQDKYHEPDKKKYHDPNEVKITIPELSSKTLGFESFTLTSQTYAAQAIDDLDSGINSISTIRTYMGSLVNRMDNQVNYLEEASLNLNDQVTTIKDADFAKESTALLTAQIQQQAAMSVLAQSNSRVSRVLEILGR